MIFFNEWLNDKKEKKKKNMFILLKLVIKNLFKIFKKINLKMKIFLCCFVNWLLFLLK